MSRRAIKSINWTGIAERLFEEEKPVFAAFKAKADGYMRRMAANPEALPKIDWAYYEKNIITSGIVQSFRKQYESIQIPYPADKYTPQIKAKIEETQEVLRQYREHLKEVNQQAEAELEKIRNSLRPSEMTMEELAERYPEIVPNQDNPSIFPHEPTEEEEQKALEAEEAQKAQQAQPFKPR